MNQQPNEFLLLLTLEAAVPLWIMQFQQLPREVLWEQLETKREDWARILAEHGDILQYGTKKPKLKGQVAEAFNALAQTLAYLSFCPEGVTFCGHHWETPMPAGGETEPNEPTEGDTLRADQGAHPSICVGVLSFREGLAQVVAFADSRLPQDKRHD